MQAFKDEAVSADKFAGVVLALLALDPAVGRAMVFDILAGEPRVKPSRALLIDPHYACRARSSRRVAAAAAVPACPDPRPALEELPDESSDDPQLAADVLAGWTPDPMWMTSVRIASAHTSGSARRDSLRG